jgi:hypothetical protein
MAIEQKVRLLREKSRRNEMNCENCFETLKYENAPVIICPRCGTRNVNSEYTTESAQTYMSIEEVPDYIKEQLMELGMGSEKKIASRIVHALMRDCEIGERPAELKSNPGTSELDLDIADNRFISDKLKQKGLEARANLAQRSAKNSMAVASSPLKRQVRLTKLLAATSGIVIYFILRMFVFAKDFEVEGNENFFIFITVAFLLGIASLVITSLTRGYALEHEKKLISAVALKGETQGVVTSMRREVRGAVSQGAGWMYVPIFTIEYEVSGQTYSTDWELSFATNVESTLQQTELKHMGAIVPVKYDIDAPENGIALHPQRFSISKKVCLVTAFLGFSIFSSMVTAVMVGVLF